MKIINLKSENFKKIKAVDITPKDSTVIISGKNGNGKTSVLDSILVALAGKQKDIIKPIREGEKKATIELDLGDFKVKRIFTEKGTTVEVFNDNAKFQSPQKMLDDLMGKLSFDPLEFSKQSQKDQRQLLMELVGLDFTKEDEKRAKLYEDRKQVGIEGKALAQYSDKEVEEARKLEGQEEKNISELSQKYQDESDKNSNYLIAKKQINDKKEDIEKLQKDIKRLEKIDDTKEDLKSLQSEIHTADEENAKIRNAKQVLESYRQVEDKRIDYKSYTEEIERIDNAKKKKLEKAKMPIDGLEISEDGVSFNKIPLSQISSAEQLKISLAVAMEMNPKIKVIRILDGSLLDEDNMEVIKEMTKDKDYQVWIEKVDSSGKVGVYIENGEIKG